MKWVIIILIMAGCTAKKVTIRQPVKPVSKPATLIDTFRLKYQQP